MKSKLVFALSLFCFPICFSCSSTPTKPNCAELQKACRQAQDVCETLEPLTGEEVGGIQHK